MKIYNLVGKYLKNNRGRIVLYVLISLLLSGLSLTIPFITGNFIDSLILKPSSAVIYKFSILIFVISIIQIIVSYIISIVSVKLTTKMQFEFNKEIIQKLQKVSLLYLESQNLIYMNQRVNTDCSSLISFSIQFLNGIIINTLTFIACVVVVIKINIKISILIIFLIVAYIVLYKVINKPLTSIKLKLKESGAMYMASFQEQLSKVRIIKIFSIFDFFRLNLTKEYLITLLHP